MPSRFCACGCGSPISGSRRYAATRCRVRAFRKRERRKVIPLPFGLIDRYSLEAVTPGLEEREDTALDVPRGRYASSFQLGRRNNEAAETSWRNAVLGARVQRIEIAEGASFAYADPPYPGTAKRYYGADPGCSEVNHQILIGSLCAHFPDGWALSTSSSALQFVLGMCPAGVRVGIWNRPDTYRRTPERPRTWEAVIFCGGRSRPDISVLDRVDVNVSPVPGFVGAKPLDFSLWVFLMLGAFPEDELEDLFPGTGAVSKAWRRFTLQRNEVLRNAVDGVTS